MTSIDDIVTEYTLIKAQADSATKRLKELREQILTRLPKGGDVAGVKVSVTRPKSIDWVKVEQAFPAVAYPQIYAQALDRDAVKQFVSPAVLDGYATEGSPRMTIK
ncbi:hypothetical protein [Flaviflexus equikiangi]|uniref:Uncharacterized protein n=1 Tax=Flaviflexus equikiangi TaxID=2758573 RepID=A0ABS2TDH7_9ACTO|nr:hypothetical protein [Flaviflexus equikiangi]MBM9432367.1 hypothetical protein [Flaviflexus equikiangi]